MKIDAIILAGGQMEESLKEFTNASSKGYMEIAGKMMIERAIDILRASSHIDRIVIAAETELVPDNIRNKADRIVQSGESIITSLKAGIAGLEGRQNLVLVIPCDMPFLTIESIEDFIEKYLEKPSDLAYGFLSRTNSEKKYPELEHTYVKLRDGEFCGTGFIILRPESVDKCISFMSKLTSNRKNPFALASIFGIIFIIKFLTRTLKISELEDRVSAITGMTARGIETGFAEAGFNIDSASHYKEAMKYTDFHN